MNHNSFEIIQCPLNPLPIRVLASSLANPIFKKNRFNPTPSYESVQKTIKDSKKSMGSRKILLTTMMEMCAGERSSLQHLLRTRLKKLKEVTQMGMIPWTPTSIKPSLVHQLNVRLPLLPCSLHRSALPKNVGS